MVSSVPDRALGLSMKLPWPANRIVFAALRRAFQARGRRTGEATKIRFGSIQIEAPLSHPAVYWRYRPVGANLNYVRLAETTLKFRSGIIVDVGANIGDGVALLRGNGIEARIFAVEGADEFAALLTRNVSHLGAIDIACCLLSDGQTDGVALEVSQGTGKLVEGKSDIRTVPLDSLYGEHDFGDVALLKTDTDGFDLKVLTGSKQILSTMGPVIFSEVDDTLLRGNGDSAAAFVDLLAASGYDRIVAWDNDGRWLGHRPTTRGVADWIATYPGGPGTPYIDVAAFKGADRALFDAFVASEDKLAANAHPTR